MFPDDDARAGEVALTTLDAMVVLLLHLIASSFVLLRGVYLLPITALRRISFNPSSSIAYLGLSRTGSSRPQGRSGPGPGRRPAARGSRGRAGEVRRGRERATLPPSYGGISCSDGISGNQLGILST